MSKDDILKWDGKYSSCDYLSEVQPDAELVQFDSILPRNGVALDLACGLGKNTLYLAQRGLSVNAIDGSAEGLKRLQKSLQVSGLEKSVTLLQVDLDEYRLAEDRFDLILVVRYLNRALFSDIERALKPGGLLFFKTFNRNILKQQTGFNPAFTIETEELSGCFPSLEVIEDNRGDTMSEYAFLIARKPY